jgi:hypothetical protein
VKRDSSVFFWALVIVAACTAIGYWLGGAMKLFLPWLFAILRQPLPIYNYNFFTIFGTALGVVVGLIWAAGVLKKRY